MKTFLLAATLLLPFMAMAQKQRPAQPGPKHFWHTVPTKASPESIWAIWTNVSQWKQWDTGLKDASLAQAFEPGAKGTITSLQDRKSKFKVVAVVPGISYTFKSALPLGGLYVKRSLEQKNGQTYFTHEVWFQGLTGGLFAKQFGPDFMKMLPEVMQNVKALAEKMARP